MNPSCVINDDTVPTGYESLGNSQPSEEDRDNRKETIGCDSLGLAIIVRATEHPRDAVRERFEMAPSFRAMRILLLTGKRR
jgi:hypothetical protein